MTDKTTSEIMSMIMSGYLLNNCKGCPFHGIKEYEIERTCDTIPLHCSWMILWKYFELKEEQESEEER